MESQFPAYICWIALSSHVQLCPLCFLLYAYSNICVCHYSLAFMWWSALRPSYDGHYFINTAKFIIQVDIHSFYLLKCRGLKIDKHICRSVHE